MEVTESLNTMLVAIVGFITAMVSWRALRKQMGAIALPLAICVGVIAGIGLAQHGGEIMPAILTLYEALAISIIVILILKPFFSHKDEKKIKPPPVRSSKKELSGDPWESELRRGGKLAKQFGTKKR